MTGNGATKLALTEPGRRSVVFKYVKEKDIITQRKTTLKSKSQFLRKVSNLKKQGKS